MAQQLPPAAPQPSDAAVNLVRTSGEDTYQWPTLVHQTRLRSSTKQTLSVGYKPWTPKPLLVKIIPQKTWPCLHQRVRRARLRQLPKSQSYKDLQPWTPRESKAPISVHTYRSRGINYTSGLWGRKLLSIISSSLSDGRRSGMLSRGKER